MDLRDIHQQQLCQPRLSVPMDFQFVPGNLEIKEFTIEEFNQWF